MMHVPEKNGGRKKVKSVAILILALSFTSVTMLPPPAHAFSCPTSSGTSKIDGCVVNSDTGNPVPGLIVVIIVCGGFQRTDWVYTDSNGYFSFHETQPNGSPCINPYQPYPVAVNGVTPITVVDGCNVPSPCPALGVAAYDATWGQWVGDVHPDGNGYGSVVIQLTPARQVLIPAASLYSNTPLASLNFQMDQSSGASNSIGISVSIGGALGVQAGFGGSESLTSTNAFTVSPTYQAALEYPYYVIGYYCAGSTAYASAGWSCSRGLQTAGATAPVPGNSWSSYPTTEYLDPNSLPGPSLTCPVTVAQGTTLSKSSPFSSGTTSDLGISSTVTLFGISATLSYTNTVSSGTTDTTGVTFATTDGLTLQFRYYPAAGSCANPTFGSALHIWDMSSPPDFSMPASPSSFNVPQGSSGWSRTSTINVQGSWGFDNLVALSASSNDPNIQLTLSPASVSANSVSISSSTLTITDPVASDTGSYSITVTGQGGGLWHSVVIPLSINPDFSMSANPTTTVVYQEQSGKYTITINNLGGSPGSVTFSSSVSGGPSGTCPSAICPSPSFVPNPLSIPAGTPVSTTMTVSVPPGTPCGTASYPVVYTVTVTGNSGSYTHTTTVQLTVYHRGDVNKDGTVDIRDLVLVASHFGTRVGSAGYYAPADLNNDGVIDISDLVIVAGVFGSTC